MRSFQLSYRYLKLGAWVAGAAAVLYVVSSLQGWGLQRHLLELQDPDLPLAQREVAAQTVWAMFQLNPSMRSDVLQQSRGLDLWLDLLCTDSPILTECGGKLLYASLATASGFESDSSLLTQGARPLAASELSSLTQALQNTACRKLCRASIFFTLELDSRQEGQPAKLAGVEGLAGPLLSAAGISPAATSSDDPLQEPDWGQAGGQSTAAHLLSNLATWPAMQSTLLMQPGLVVLLAGIIGGKQAVLDAGIPAAAARLVANLAHTNAGAHSLYDEATGQGGAAGSLLLNALLELGRHGDAEERLAACLALENLAAGSPGASKALLAAGAHVMLLDAASGSASSALQMAAVHAAYNILACQKGWKGLSTAALPPAPSSDAAEDLVSSMSSTLVPDQLLRALKGALIKGPEASPGSLLSWGSSLVGGNSAGAQGGDWAIMRGLALCGDGAGSQSCYSIHHNAAPGLGLHVQGGLEDPDMEQSSGSSAGMDRALAAATVGAGCSMVAAQLLSGSPSLHPDHWGSSADPHGFAGDSSRLSHGVAGGALMGGPASNGLQYLSCYGPEPGSGEEKAAWMLSSLPESSNTGAARLVTGMRDLWTGSSYWRLGSSQAIPATLRAWMLVGSASLSSLWQTRIFPVVHPILQVMYQGSCALGSIVTSVCTLLATAFRDTAIGVWSSLQQTFSGLGSILWQWVGRPFKAAALAAWQHALWPLLGALGACMSGLAGSMWAAVHAVLAVIGAFLWRWLLQPLGQVLGSCLVMLGLGLQATGLWIWSCIMYATASLLDLLWRYLLSPVFDLLAKLVGGAAVFTGGLIGMAALLNVAADWLGLGNLVDLIAGRPRRMPPMRY
ncbi:hypothetical protein WJX74_005532 [Apatococcus lobatus]|uniref:Uncharacterized protein n=1 Tax=Apatococcus lobatus TaxID=904363 RepID=A0AAW1QCM6_9CHLO